LRARLKDVTLTSEPDNILEKEVFEKLRKLGMSVVKIKTAPFNAITKEEEDDIELLTGIDERKTGRTLKRAELVSQMAEVVGSDGVFVVKKARMEVVRNVPILPKKLLEEIKDADELLELIRDLKFKS